MHSVLRKLSLTLVSMLVGCMGYPAVVAPMSAAARGEETDLAGQSELVREFVSGRHEGTSRSGRGKHRSACRELIPLDRLHPATGRLAAALAPPAASSPRTPEQAKQNGCGAFLLI